VHRVTVFGRCEETAGTDSFDRLVHEAMTRELSVSARRVC
jgi:hypothetical protein